MKGINDANFAKVMFGSVSMELALGQRVLALSEFKILFMGFYHERIFAAAYGTIACGQFWEIS